MVIYLSGTHGGFESREAVVEGAENGDHVFGAGLALLQRLSYGRSSLAQSLHCLWNPHCFFLLLLLSRFLNFPSLSFLSSLFGHRENVKRNKDENLLRLKIEMCVFLGSSFFFFFFFSFGCFLVSKARKSL